jgi:hypothetical protein
MVQQLAQSTVVLVLPLTQLATWFMLLQQTLLQKQQSELQGNFSKLSAEYQRGLIQ